MIEIYTPGRARRFMRRRARELAALSFAAGDRLMRVAGSPRIAGGSEDLAQQFPVRVLQVTAAAGIVAGGSATPPWSNITPSTTPLVVRGQNTQAPSNVSSSTFTYPTGTRAGDVVLCLQNSSGVLTPGTSAPSGAQLDTASQSGNITLLQWLAGLETQAVVTGSGMFAGIIASVGPSAGVGGIIRLDAEAGYNHADAANITPTWAIVTTVANCVALVIAAHNGSSGTLSAGAGWTAASPAFSAVGLGAWWQNITAAGAVPGITITDSGGTSTKGWAANIVTLMPLGN